MSADVKLWPYEPDNSHNICWDGVVNDLTQPGKGYIRISEEYGCLTLPDIFEKWPHLMEKEFWGVATDKDGNFYLHGRVG